MEKMENIKNGLKCGGNVLKVFLICTILLLTYACMILERYRMQNIVINYVADVWNKFW